MENYIQKVINLFTASEHSEKVTTKVHRWLLKDIHVLEKEAAIHAQWSESEGKIDAGTWTSLSKVYNKIGVTEGKKRFCYSYKVWRNVAAAAVVVAVVSVSGAFFFAKTFYSESVMIESLTSAGDMSLIELPDGSQVQTNSGTLLLYPEKFKGNTRTVYLIGEANFKVKKNPDKPFIVKSATVAVTALGTEFNVSAYPENEDIVATLIQGKIKVDCGNHDPYILTPGQQVTYMKYMKRSMLVDANLQDVTAWQKGLNIFRAKTVKEILSVLERRFNVTFQYNINQFGEDKYNFSFRGNSDITEIMNIMKEVVQGFDYRIKENVCYIKFKR